MSTRCFCLPAHGHTPRTLTPPYAHSCTLTPTHTHMHTHTSHTRSHSHALTTHARTHTHTEMCTPPRPHTPSCVHARKAPHMFTCACDACILTHVPPCSHTHIGTHVRTQPTKAASCIPAAWPAQLAETQQCKSAQSRHSWEDVGRGPSLSQAYSQGMKMSSSCLACVPQGLTETKGVLSKGNWGC